MNIIVIGDVILDINYISHITRKAAEADIPIYDILNNDYKLGGSGNVCQNLKNLETNVEIISVIGNDSYGTIITNLLKNKNINNKLFIDKTRKTTIKNRIFLDNKLQFRFDIEDNNDISDDIQKEIVEYVFNKDTIDAVIISDYNKGVCTEYLCETLIKYCNENNIPSFVDPKIKNVMKYKGCFLFKPNLYEAENICQEKNITKILNSIKSKIECKNVVLTLSEDGIILNNIHNKIKHKNKIQLTDVTGAGDIVLTIISYIYLKYKDLLKACRVANYIAGKSVSVIGNYNTNLEDINEYFEIEENNNIEKIIYDYNIDKINRLAKERNVVFTNGCFDILHSAHIELLKFAKQQGDILIVGLNSDDSIKRLKGENRPINNIIERSKILSLFDFIDYVIIFHDDTPLNILQMLKPDILIKGSDYNINNVIGKEYVKEILFFNYIENLSSTNIINKIKNQ
jgi:D-beta-D-heptose 7-phosphate kinase/D-beta-D-heptose 1-phosphate adenosyltransferase